MAPRLRPLLTPPNDGTQKENRLDLRVALNTGAGQLMTGVRKLYCQTAPLDIKALNRAALKQVAEIVPPRQRFENTIHSWHHSCGG